MLRLLGSVMWTLWCWLELVLFSIVLYLLSWLPLWHRPGPQRLYFIAFRSWCRFFVRALRVELRLQEKNRHRLPTHYIMIANHPSAFEDVGIPALFPVHSLAKIEVRDWWWAGRINIAAGTLFVQRESAESRRQAIAEIEACLAQGKNVVLYPEGGCKGRRIFESFRHGAFDVSLRTGVPIVPVFLHYEMQDRFEWQPPYGLMAMMWRMLSAQNRRANYYVHDAIDPAHFRDKATYEQHVRGLFLKWQTRYLD